MHPVHPMLVHVPIACLLFTPLSDGAALFGGGSGFWSVSALLAGAAIAFGALAATAGAMDLPRATGAAARIALIHASLMGSAVAIAGIGLIGRIHGDFSVAAPAPVWAIAAGLIAALVMLTGAYFGGELVYGRGVGVRSDRAE